MTFPRLGLGAGHIGSPEQDEDQIGAFLHSALDLGVTLIDTARGYNLSEERIGRHLSSRRKEFLLSTKVGYGIEGHADWSYDGVVAGVAAALNRLRTDHLDVVHLHSCSLEVLKKGDVIRALERCRTEGTVGRIAYSGENDELDWAVDSGFFDSFQCSINVADQRSIDRVLPKTRSQGWPVIAKRPLANAPWRFTEQPVGQYAEAYWLRLREMNLALDWATVALRFTAFLPGVSTCIVGTANLEHLRHHVEDLARGPLPATVVDQVRKAFAGHPDWVGQV